ncbi:hypothetical protein GCM10022255_031680 [Dactylosporangium darangshiense]|uniref:site-specific DNA-methyltransferase (adenine-specific) n=2 Tax=Dactylosporangium darangshiense TaxID=579108 RepID=A0ABP8D757_9ACTN
MRARPEAPDGLRQHRDWLALIDVEGPFLSLPVLRATWPTLDPLDKGARERLRAAHATWQDDIAAGQAGWVGHVLRELLGWGDALHLDGLDDLTVRVPEHDTDLAPSFALSEAGSVRVLGVVCPPGQRPTARVPGSTWGATPADRLAHLCRHHGVELGLVTDGRWWALVWAPRGGVTATAVFDAVAWPEAAQRDVVRAFVSLLCRRRFFGVPDAERLVPLLRRSLDNQEELTEALGVQVRRAVELLVAAFGRADARERELGGRGLELVTAHEVYRGAVSVMMRLVFLLFAEERRLLPSDNELYATEYGAGRLRAGLEDRVAEGSEEDLEHTSAAWHRMLALFDAVYHGIAHPRLTMHAHAGSLFDPGAFPWLPQSVDDRTVLHMLRAVQRVEIGRGRAREVRTVSFRALDVEQIGYVYEGLLSFEGLRADGVVVGLDGREGRAEEVPLSVLEALPSAPPELAAALAERYKDSGIGSPAALAKRLTPLGAVERAEARRKLLAVTGGDHPLAERLLPYFGVIRDDLRGLPTVILPGALYVTESALRRNTGTHYTPRFLAEEVVEGALEPLVYEPGPLQTADTAQWRRRSSKEILALKVVDIAMGSAAFLVAAARYLAGHLMEAWSAEGVEQPLVLDAHRQVIEHCLYGVDINPMAVEMAKLSLWLVSMYPERPFTFLDDRLVAGDSLLGITDLGPVESLEADLFGWAAGVAPLVHEVAETRRAIAGVGEGDLVRKRQLLDEAAGRAERLRVFADVLVGAALATGGRAAAYVEGALDQRQEWLATDHVPGSFPREPLHWPLVFPEVFEGGGFDAVIGNPPFLGGKKISGALGTAYRELLVETLGRGVRGNADLAAYFVLRAHDVLAEHGQTGLVATNTLAQGDTREVGLDQLTAGGVTIRRAVKSRPWPSRSAVLEYCAVWTSRATTVEPGVTSSLDPASRTAGNAHRLAANAGLSHIGSLVLGMGFTLTPEAAEALLRKDERNRDVLAPYLNGQDLNSRPDCSASRWVIDFHDWSEERAREYGDCYEQVYRTVKPERDKNQRNVYRTRWWQFAEKQPSMLRAIAPLDRVVVIALVSKTVMPVMVQTGNGTVFAHKLAVFATDDPAMLALLSSAPHYWWAVGRSSTMKADLNYSPTDVFGTLPRPEPTGELRELGARLDRRRREIMLDRAAGLTATYGLVNDPGCHDTDIAELRALHRDIDAAVCAAYGWDDLTRHGLDHGFHATGPYTRYTAGPAARREMTDRLLELNHRRYEQEAAAGLHDKRRGTARRGGAGRQEAMF